MPGEEISTGIPVERPLEKKDAMRLQTEGLNGREFESRRGQRLTY
jgi:hypothetical protein